ncbi:MAG: deoxyguanosinetriphosphate triphosphohydrolase [Sphingomonadales bacterium]
MITDQNFLNSFATKSENSRGRIFNEEESSTRSVFQRDRDRIIHCSAFRRLKHKTQVFVYHEGDYYRTRLTHSIEVAQIARSISRYLKLNEDLAEALALAHDFGHTAFGHAGEDALALCMENYEGFDHNAQSLRLVTKLEKRYGAFQGLNLTWETLEGLAKHNGPLSTSPIDHKSPPKSLPWALREFLPKLDLEIHTYAGPEAQVAAISDDIAYNHHDMDDGLRAGLFKLEDLAEVGFVGEMIRLINNLYPKIEESVLVHELVRRLINLMVEDLLKESQSRLVRMNVRSVEDVRCALEPIISLSDKMAKHDKELKTFLMNKMYQHPKVNRMAIKGKKVVTDLFNLYIEEPECMPLEWSQLTEGPRMAETARVVADFIAGMTDRFALREHHKFFDVSDI